jgi:O-acetyl-ADP-ribose deacetylase (regulator of RNase III)
MNSRIILHQGDITKLEVDAIVNAANRALRGGGGVDGAIHRAAGPELLKECISLNGCEAGMAKITKGYNLPAKYVIHTVGPIWKGGMHDEPALLENCYLKSLKIAAENQFKSIAFPNISTGVYGYPKLQAAEIAIKCVHKFLRENDFPERVFFALFDEDNLHIYSRLLKSINL